MFLALEVARPWLVYFPSGIYLSGQLVNQALIFSFWDAHFLLLFFSYPLGLSSPMNFQVLPWTTTRLLNFIFEKKKKDIKSRIYFLNSNSLFNMSKYKSVSIPNIKVSRSLIMLWTIIFIVSIIHKIKFHVWAKVLR